MHKLEAILLSKLSHSAHTVCNLHEDTNDLGKPNVLTTLDEDSHFSLRQQSIGYERDLHKKIP